MAFEREKPTGQVRSLTRALTLLKALGERGEGMTLSELSEAAGLPPSTTHRLLTTMESERFVRPDPQGGHWRIGVAAFLVGTAFSRARDRVNLIRPFMMRVMETTGETASLYVESDNEAVCIGQIESRHAMRTIIGLGGRVPLHASAAGKVLLAHMDPARRATVLDRLPFESFTEATNTTREALESSLEEVRSFGYGIDDEEFAVGMRCVAAPIFDETGQPVAALSASGPVARLTRSRIAAVGRTVAQAALEATREYGGEEPLAAQ